MSSDDTAAESFLVRHQFLIYRLFSLAGLLPVGAFLVVHLLTNSSILGGPESFQDRVDTIHALGPLLVPVEVAFIFLPILFHAVVGFAIIAGGLPNVGSYPYAGNIRYTLQRATGMIAFAFIVWHLVHLHWLGAPVRGASIPGFDPHHASSTLAVAMRSLAMNVIYAVGMLAAVYHFANGLWSLGITWGLWTSPAAMRRANWVSIVVGVVLAGAGLGSLVGVRRVDVDAARSMEQRRDEVRRMMEGRAATVPTAAGEAAVAHEGI